MLIFSFISKTIKPFKLQLIFFIFVSVASAIDLSLRPYFLKRALDSAILTNNFEYNDEFFFYIFLYLFALGIIFLIDILYEYIWIEFFPRLKRNIGNLVFKELIEQPYTFYQNNFSGGLTNRLNNCISSVPRIIKALNEDFFRSFLAIVISVYTLHYISFKYSIALLIWAIIYIGSSLILAPLVKKRSAIAAKEASKGVGYIIDVLNNIINIKLFTSKALEIATVNDNFKRWETYSKSNNLLLVNLYTFQTITFFIFQVVCIYWMIKLDGKINKINPGNLILFFSVSFSIYSSLLGLSKTIADYSENIGVVSEALNIIYAFKEIRDKPCATIFKFSKGQITFHNVKFHYKDTGPLFQKKSIEIKGGQKVGLVGYSGSGKSTFVNLILRLYDVTEGAIFIDDQDIRNVTQDSLRENIAMIPQDPSLFHRSLMENIRYGRPQASNEEVVEAAKKAHAHEFIEKLPKSYDSLVGEKGIKLSGGQRQRIAIARAILKNASIIILDEATSQLDSVTENLIQESLWLLMQGKTNIVIAHRLSTLLHMDRILVFDKGKIVEDGTHNELLEKQGLYKSLWAAQVGGFLGDGKRDNEE